MAIQFNHRVLGLAVLCALVWNVLAVRYGSSRRRRAALLVLAMGLAQAALGIVTLVHQVPVALGAMHQAGALLLFSLTLYHYHLACFEPRPEYSL